MTNRKTQETVEQTDIKIDEDTTQKTINELKAQISLLTQMITSQSQRNVDAENAFFKQKEICFTVTTFKEPNQKADVKEIKVKS